MEQKIAERLAALHRELAAVYQDLAKEQSPAGSDRVIGLPEAAIRLDVTVSWLCRAPNWRAVGGFKGPDRRVHFPLSVLEAAIKARTS
jgi:hypothetical protein